MRWTSSLSIPPDGRRSTWGASTGGFTDVLLRRGAAHVFAVDVGRDQLDPNLREDPRVTVLEKVNARDLTRDHITAAVDLVVCDVSFISLKLALPAVLAMARGTTRLVALIKPQFEAGRGRVGKGGIVRDEAVHRLVCDEIVAWIEALGWQVDGLEPSPIEGPDGNREFLITAVQKGTADAD